jgi:hypothetical protein
MNFRLKSSSRSHKEDCDDDDHGLCLDTLKSFRQVNRALYACPNRSFWRETLDRRHTTARILTLLIHKNDLAGLKFFLELGIDIEITLPDFPSADITLRIQKSFSADRRCLSESCPPRAPLIGKWRESPSSSKPLPPALALYMPHARPRWYSYS